MGTSLSLLLVHCLINFNAFPFRCQPVFCKYQFFKQPEHCSLGREQRENVYWDDINVVLLGNVTLHCLTRILLKLSYVSPYYNYHRHAIYILRCIMTVTILQSCNFLQFAIIN